MIKEQENGHNLRGLFAFFSLKEKSPKNDRLTEQIVLRLVRNGHILFIDIVSLKGLRKNEVRICESEQDRTEYRFTD